MRVGLGIAPAILIGGGAAAGAAVTGAAAGVVSSYNSGFLNNLFQTLGLKDTPSLPITNPALLAPSAPQTEYAMKYWSPDWQNEAAAQRQVQHRAEVQASSNSDGGDSGAGISLGILALVAVAAVGAGMLLNKR